ncbi:MAG: hypothetical protein JNM79_16615 [Burkholderiales bacterium]|nr:hypothetical protein [Burkholderiales bacterium]
MLACAAAAAWLHLDVAPRVAGAGAALRAELARTQSVSDALVSNGLAHGLAGGDYGEVQESLTQYQRAGFLTRALVINASGKSVAVVGSLEGLRIGEVVPAQILATGRQINLSAGAQNLGQLLILGAPAAGADSLSKETQGLRLAAILVGALALISAGAVVWLRREALRDIDNALRGASRARAERKAAELPAFSEQDLQDIGRSTMQSIESELRKRIAESRARRSGTAGDASPAERSSDLADQALGELGQQTRQGVEPDLRDQMEASRLRELAMRAGASGKEGPK